MRFPEQADISAHMLAQSAHWRRVCELVPEADDDLAQMVFTGAAEFAEARLSPLNAIGDRQGCVLVDGQVRVPAAYHDVWRDLAADGWIGIDVSESAGGQGLPLAVQAGCQMLFDRAAMAFGMLGGSTRCSIFVLDAYADDATKQEWCSKLASGEWSATICISESDAGSDLGRVRTSATKDADGVWRVSGEKSWISYGGHDLTSRIGHMVLARTGDVPGTRGLSLFLVPSTDDAGAQNGVYVERIEEKLGLHGSPTCVLRFDGAKAILIGEEGRGLPQLFVMIERMRLLTAGQGAGVALASYDVAQRYASERKQGGPSSAPPVAIAAHADVQRQLAEMAGRAYVAQALVLELAAILDLAALEPDETKRAEHAALAAFLLPIAKNFGGEAGFDVANRAIQVLGGAGYTQEWPVEQYLRDTRVLTIFEGTTGMQALDLLHRRLWKEHGHGLAVFGKIMRSEIARSGEDATAKRAQKVLEGFEQMADQLLGQPGDDAALYAAEPFLNAAWAAVSAWMGLRLTTSNHPDARIGAAGRLRVEDALIALSAAKESAARSTGNMEVFGPRGA